MSRILPLALLFAAVTAHAQPYSRVLVPIYLDQPIPGAYGSLWASEFAVHNRDAQEFILQWCSPYPEGACILNLYPDEQIKPNETETRLPERYPKPHDGIPGAVLYVSPRDIGPLDFQLRVADRSRSAQSAGTAIPIVREGEFRTSAANLLNVPVDPLFRLTFRIYEMNLDRADFTVRVFDQETAALLQTRTVTTTTTGPQGVLRFQPAYAQFDQIVDGAPSRVRVEVEPLTHGVAFWTFASITNNDTQQITIVTP